MLTTDPSREHQVGKMKMSHTLGRQQFRKPFVWMILTCGSAASGCSMATLLEQNAAAVAQASQAMRDTTHSVETTSQTLHAIEPSLARVAALGPELAELSELRTSLVEIGRLREELAQISGMSRSLRQISALDQRLSQVTALDSELARLVELREPLLALADVAERASALERLNQPLTAAAALEPSLRDLELGLRKLEKLTTPLHDTSRSLARILDLIDDSPWLLALGFVFWLTSTCAAAGVGTFVGLRAHQRARDMAKRQHSA